MARKRKDPKVGTGKKPKGTGRRLYTDENPKDTVRINRKIQILTVMEQRAKVAGKNEQARIAKRAKETLKKRREKK